MKQHYDYFTRIIDWASERGILKHGRLRKQLLKSTEECTELQRAIESYENGDKNAIHEIEDAIGDIYVTLVISTHMRFKNAYLLFKMIKTRNEKFPFECDVDFYIDELKELDTTLYKLYTAEMTKTADLFIFKYVDFLNHIANDYNLQLVDCINTAYTTISKRSGKMIDGTFVKDK